jgi:DnaJ-domain-containing protein 1
MDLFSRLIRIVESWVNTVDSGTRSSNSYRRSEQQSGQSHSGQYETNPDRDPKLEEYYANLEIPYGSDIETVQSAWKKQMRRYHPDLHANDPEKRKTAKILAQRLNKAYEELTEYLTNSNN